MRERRTILVHGERGDYPVIVERGAFDALGECIAAACGPPPTRVALLHDPGLPADLARRAAASLVRSGTNASVPAVALTGLDAGKSLAVVEAAAARLLALGLDRRSRIVALGGGAALDVAGFVAAIFKRGIDVVHVPTTLLAQVDAAIGGKTAVDLAGGRNQLGAFHAPRAVVVDPALLATLPDAEFRSGLGEVLKYGFLAGEELLAEIERSDAAALRRGADPLDALVARCVAFKAQVVGADERDHGARRTLNLGHTFGHALEAATGYRALRHGEAVAIGLIGEAELARRLGLAGPEVARRAAAACARLGLPARARGVDVASVARHLAHDKKREGDALLVALPLAPGRVEVLPVRDGAAIDGALRSILDP